LEYGTGEKFPVKVIVVIVMVLGIKYFDSKIKQYPFRNKIFTKIKEIFIVYISG
jgi:hypothetical protein